LADNSGASRPLRTILLLIFALGLVALICGGLIYLLVGDELIDYGRQTYLQISLSFREDELDTPVGTDPTEITFTVNQGDNARTIARSLVAAGLIVDAELFVDYVRAEGLDGNLEAGKFFLSKTQNIREIAQSLTDSRFSQIDFVIVPGWRIEQVAEAIDNNRLFDFSGDEFLTLVGLGANVDPQFAQIVGLPAGASLEGFLYPDTYALKVDITATELRDLLLDAFLTAVGPSLIEQAEAQGFTMYEIVTLASIIEREALHSDEKPRISSAYRNRLAIDMKLDADPTVQYPLGTSENWWPRISSANYTSTISSYNTYLNEGLPPGPIANPSISSIRAAINPEETNFFYFRADCRGDGYHDFATTYAEHLANGC